MNTKPKIFLSYTRQDEASVSQLYQALVTAGFSPWMDTKDILPGENWRTRTQQALRSSDFFLACLSKRSIDKRGFMQRELRQAHDIWLEHLDYDIYVIPVRLEECEVPEALRDFQWVDLYEANGLTRLIQAIQAGTGRGRTRDMTKSSKAEAPSPSPSPPPVVPAPPQTRQARAGPEPPVKQPGPPGPVRPTLLNAFIGDYRLVDFLGAGGMGEVYRAVHTKIGRVVAIKVLTRIVHNRSFVERFFNEARIQARLQHENIVMLYDFLEHHGQPCIIMEYVDGQTLDEYIRRRGALPVTEACAIFQTIVKALAYVHSQGVVHRDLKTNNIKIGAHGEVKLLDFGIAKAGSTPHLTLPGEFVGTLDYLSPEQVKGRDTDARTDFWQLGILLYEMVTGKVPFAATSIGDLYEKITKASYVQPSALNAAVPREVETIASRCLKKNPTDRYQSAQELLQELQRISSPVAPPPIPSKRPSPEPPIPMKRPSSEPPIRMKRPSSEPPITPPRKTMWYFFAAVALLALLITFGIYIFSDGDYKGKTITTTIDVYEGTAEVYLNGERKGHTPYPFEAQAGTRFEVTLKSEGFKERKEPIYVTANNHQFKYHMERIK